jgi:hypothetical protein
MNNQKGGIGLYLGLLAFAAGAFLFFGRYFGVFFRNEAAQPASVADAVETMPADASTDAAPVAVPPQPMPAAHIETPEPMRAIYLTGWSAGTKRMIDHAFSIFDTTDSNSVVIDIKDATGRLSYQPLDPQLLASGVGTKRIADLPALIDRLHARGIYVIGRVQVFEDPYYAKSHPESAFQNTKTESVWTDYKGIAWLRPDATDVWNYVAMIANDAYAQGFDEINLDYVRFPSDGPLWQMADRPTGSTARIAVLETFFSFINDTLRTQAHIPVSADLFGLTLSTTDDMGIGQDLVTVAPLVDYVDPMIYPSHFAPGSYGYASPSEHPYAIIAKALSDGKQKLAASGMTEAIAEAKLRPWLQDFDLLGVHYDTAKVQAQIAATLDAGIEDFLMWDPRNIYTAGALTDVDAQKTAVPETENDPVANDTGAPAAKTY